MRSWVLEVIDKLADHTGQEPNQAQVENWVSALDQYHLVTMLRAADEWIQHSKWFPKLSEFRSLVLAHTDTSNKRAVYWRAMDAWNDWSLPREQLEQDVNWRWCAERGVVDVQETVAAIPADV